MRRPNFILSDSIAWRSVAAATACLILLGMFAAGSHAHDLDEVRDADCVGCRFMQAQTFAEPGVETPVFELCWSPLEAEVVDSPVVDQHYRLAPLRGPPTLA